MSRGEVGRGKTVIQDGKVSPVCEVKEEEDTTRGGRIGG
jgi:hypothetical protein